MFCTYMISYIYIFQTLEDKLIIYNYEKLELAPPERPEVEQEEAPSSSPPGVGVHSEVDTPPYSPLTHFTIHSTHSDMLEQS